MNDFMIALNGWHTTERSLREVYWRIMMFHGIDWLQDEWDEEKGSMSESYLAWLNKSRNRIYYTDRLCGIERMHRPSGYGFMQGYLNADACIEELKKNGSVTIPFSRLYDIRQYYKGQDGCFMKIEKV